MLNTTGHFVPPEVYLRELSGGRVVGIRPSGPVFSSRIPPRRVASRSTFVWALSRPMRILVGFISLTWLVTLALFLAWWSLPEHRLSIGAFVFNTALLFYVLIIPGYFVVAANRLRKVNPALNIPPMRVAMVVTKAPSEPWSMVRETLSAMLKQQFPHPYDVWLADESPTAEVEAWCASRGVSISTRRGVPEYQRTQWPRRRRCKEGNLAYFYDHYGYAAYDVVSQLDADHVPEPTYLAEMVRPFADPAIGYVAAPSVCGANEDVSWAVRGRLYRESVFHGPHQLGHNHGLGPVAIGSHYAVRTEALKEIGGLGPELAEDFTTSYLMNVAGWSGAFAIEAHANGEGPDTLGAMLTQEFQWSRSLAMCSMTLVPRTLKRVPWRMRLRFGFALAFYPMLWLTSMMGIVLAPVAAVTDVSWVRVNYGYFLVFWFAISLQLGALAWLSKRAGLLRPRNAPLMSWEQWVYVFARWPFVGFGVVAAFAEQFRRKPLDFKVTPKHDGTRSPLPAKIFVPFLIIAFGLCLAAIYGTIEVGPVGYVGLTILGASAYVMATCAFTIRHALEARQVTAIGFFRALRLIWAPLLGCLAAGYLLVIGISAYAQYLLLEFRF
ncbi:glycosyltransferase family 2 protein [Smaragdicoccus niigatensis]